MGINLASNPWMQSLISTGIPLYSFSLTPLETDQKITEAWKGCGRAILQNESIYEGEMLNGKPHGKGLCIQQEGHIYIGEWVDGDFSGKGRLLDCNGNDFEGDWSNNLPHGNMVCTSKLGKIDHGIFVEGKKHGFFAHRFPNGGTQWITWDQDRLVEIHDMDLTKVCLCSVNSKQMKSVGSHTYAIDCFNKAFPVVVEIYPELEEYLHI